MPAAICRKTNERPTKRSFEDKCVPKPEFGNEGGGSTSLRRKIYCKRFGLARRIDIVLRSRDRKHREKEIRYGRKKDLGKMGRAATAGRRRGIGQWQPAVRRQRSGGTQPAIRGDLYQMRRAIVH